MESIWEKTCRGPARPPLYGKAQADVAVIGGGMTGILTALELQERGLQVVVAEAGHVGGGQTGRTTAKLTAQHGAIYAGLIERLGREKAAMYARANRRAVERCCARIELEQIDCDLERTDSWLYSYDREDSLLREAEAERALGLDASFEPDTPLPLRVCGGVRLRGQAQFHPLKFLQALADRLTIYERTPVEHVEGGTLFTPRGTIEAGRVVFASHYPFVNVPGLYFARMHQERSYAIALENAVLPAGMYYGLEPNAWSLRSYRGTVILGGGAHRTGRNGGGHYAALREAAQALFPGSREAAHWSAQDCMTASGVPYIGRFSARDPQWYVATGFRKWGMSNAMAAAELLTALICDGSHPDAAAICCSSGRAALRRRACRPRAGWADACSTGRSRRRTSWPSARAARRSWTESRWACTAQRKSCITPWSCAARISAAGWSGTRTTRAGTARATARALTCRAAA